ncbi:MAG: putative alkylation repair enzyme [Ignavibacteria bacterium]|nr:putative alkylation repair enzyme [Ignavibacteria bacterium]
MMDINKKILEEIILELKANKNPENVAGMARFGISAVNTLGIKMPVLREIAKRNGKNHALAAMLWETDIHEARILAAFTAEYKKATWEEMDKWARGFDSWDVCDQCCGSFFWKVPFAFDIAESWMAEEAEFVKRAGFALLAFLAVHRKKADDADFERFFKIIVRECKDGRNFVKKAVNWALRQIGKRNINLNNKCINLCHHILDNHPESASARWIARDALRELTDKKHIERMKKKKF